MREVSNLNKFHLSGDTIHFKVSVSYNKEKKKENHEPHKMSRSPD
jgi:hypothetical protein